MSSTRRRALSPLIRCRMSRTFSLSSIRTDSVISSTSESGGGPLSSRAWAMSSTTSALHELLPYRPELLAVEPGRCLVAESAVLVGDVLGREVRAGENCAYLDVGADNGLMETQQTGNQWRYPLWSSRHDHAAAHPRRSPRGSSRHAPAAADQVLSPVPGPSRDSSDTTFFGVYLPATLDAGDR